MSDAPSATIGAKLAALVEIEERQKRLIRGFRQPAPAPVRRKVKK